jgi:hypothetical protein
VKAIRSRMKTKKTKKTKKKTDCLRNIEEKNRLCIWGT